MVKKDKVEEVELNEAVNKPVNVPVENLLEKRIAALEADVAKIKKQFGIK
mgnify:CR=1